MSLGLTEQQKIDAVRASVEERDRFPVPQPYSFRQIAERMGAWPEIATLATERTNREAPFVEPIGFVVPKSSPGEFRTLARVTLLDQVEMETICRAMAPMAAEMRNGTSYSFLVAPDPRLSIWEINPDMPLDTRFRWRRYASANRSMSRQFDYCQKLDVADCFPSIHHDRLLGALRSSYSQVAASLNATHILGRALGRIGQMLSESTCGAGVGLVQSGNSSFVLAESMFLDVDQICFDLDFNATRFVDEMRIFDSCPLRIAKAYERIETELTAIGFAVNQNKTGYGRSCDLPEVRATRLISELDSLIEVFDPEERFTEITSRIKAELSSSHFNHHLLSFLIRCLGRAVRAMGLLSADQIDLLRSLFSSYRERFADAIPCWLSVLRSMARHPTGSEFLWQLTTIPSTFCDVDIAWMYQILRSSGIRTLEKAPSDLTALLTNDIIAHYASPRGDQSARAGMALRLLSSHDPVTTAELALYLAKSGTANLNMRKYLVQEGSALPKEWQLRYFDNLRQSCTEIEERIALDYFKSGGPAVRNPVPSPGPY